MTDAATLWQQLLDAGRVSGAPPQPSRPPTPWPLRLLTGVAAWIATPLLLGFFAAALGNVLLREGAGVVVGPVLMLASLPMLRRDASDFMHQAATVVSLAGLLLLGVGVAFGLDLGANGTAAVMLLAAGALFIASREPVHRFACAGVVIVAAAWLVSGGSPLRAGLLHPLLAAATAAAWGWRLGVDPARRDLAEALAPLAWALTLAALASAWFDPMLGVEPLLRDGSPDVSLHALVAARLAAAAVLPATALALVWPHRAELSTPRLAGWLLCSLLLAWLWWHAPGASFALVLMLLAFAAGHRLLLAVACLALGSYLVTYYYQLGVPLLSKAQALGIAGAVLLAAHVALRRWPARGATP